MNSQEQIDLEEVPYPHLQHTVTSQHQDLDDSAFDTAQQNATTAGMARPLVLRTAGPLTTFDVFSFIVNKMVGTGIFTAPSIVLALTDDRRIAVSLWALAFLYTIITCVVFSSQNI